MDEEARQGGGDRRVGMPISSVGRVGSFDIRGRLLRGVDERVVGYYNQREARSDALVHIICIDIFLSYCITFWLCTRVAR